MSKSPPIPPEQRAVRGPRPNLAKAASDRDKTGLPGEADANLREAGRHDDQRQGSAMQYRHQGR